MSTKLNFGRDVQGYNAYAPDFAADNFSATITNGVAESFTVPADHAVYIAVFSYQPGVNVWVARNTTAAIPVGATFAATASCLNPSARIVYKDDVISCITDNPSVDVGISLYAVAN